MLPSPLKRNAGVSSSVLFDPVALLNEHMRIPAGSHAKHWRLYFDPVKVLSDDLPVPILGIMLLVWQLRARDLQVLFPLDCRESRLDFICWCMSHGWREYAALRQAGLFWRALEQPARLEHGCADAISDRHDAAHAMSWKIWLLQRMRPDLAFDTGSSKGRAQFMYWYLVHGRLELPVQNDAMTEWQSRYLFSASAMPGLNHLQHLVYQSRPDIQQLFLLPRDQLRYLAWFQRFISEETTLADFLREKTGDASQHASSQAAPAALPFGANIIGYAYGQLGIGEDARMACASLSHEMPVGMVNFAPGNDIPQGDFSMAHHVTDQARHAINIFCLSAEEHGRCFAERGTDMFERHFNIGYWPWELEKWPSEWLHLFCLVDEVWLSSQHTLGALRPACPLPLRLMPLAVQVTGAGRRRRASFGLPLQDCLFLFAFDLNSSARRKNPKACLQAFLRAFPKNGAYRRGAQQVGLVIKVHRPSVSHPQWEELKQMQAQDARIHLIEETLSRADLLALYRACDCFISLHRAEGFGRNMAEAMLLGKPVISTGYSGNMTFTDETNALLVKYRLQPLLPGDYPHGAGQVWAEPSVADAARQMQRVYLQQGDDISALAARGRARIRKQHHPQVVGKKYAAALRQIWRALPAQGW